MKRKVQDRYNTKWRCCPHCEEYMTWLDYKYHSCTKVQSVVPEDQDGEFIVKDYFDIIEKQDD